LRKKINFASSSTNIFLSPLYLRLDDYLVAVVMAAEAQRPPRLVHKPEGREHAQHGRAFAHLQRKKLKIKISGSFATKIMPHF
jgi:hypothetical protein